MELTPADIERVVTAALAEDVGSGDATTLALVPEDAKEASGYGVRAKRSKSGAISFEVLDVETAHAAL